MPLQVEMEEGPRS